MVSQLKDNHITKVDTELYFLVWDSTVPPDIGLCLPVSTDYNRNYDLILSRYQILLRR